MRPRAREPGAAVDIDVPLTAIPRSSVPLENLDLFRAGGLDPRPISFFDPSTHPNMAVFQSVRCNARAGKDALVPFQDRNRQRLRPPPPEIHIYSAAALADRQYLAFCQRKKAPAVQELRPAVGPDDGIVRFAPEAKLGVAGGALVGQKFGRASPVADPARRPWRSPPPASRGRPTGRRRARPDARRPAGGRSGRSVPGPVGAVRFSCRPAGSRAPTARRVRPAPAGPARRRHERDFDGVEADFAPVREHDGPAVGDGTRPRRRRPARTGSGSRGQRIARGRRRPTPEPLRTEGPSARPLMRSRECRIGAQLRRFISGIQPMSG